MRSSLTNGGVNIPVKKPKNMTVEKWLEIRKVLSGQLFGSLNCAEA